MADLKTILKKLFIGRQNNVSLDQAGNRMSSEEHELMRFKEKERQEGIRAELNKYRLKKTSELLTDATLFDKSKHRSPSILGTENLFNKKCGRIL